MKPALLIATAAIAALPLAACNKNAGNSAAGAASDVTGAAGNIGNSAMSAAGNAGATAAGAVDKAQNAVGAAVGATSAATLGSHDTGAFVDNLVQANTYEIDAARIAQQKAKSPDVKAFARQMVVDHTALGNEAKPVIAKSGKSAPSGLDQRRQGLLDNLKSASAQDFDKTYVDQQVAGHKEVLTLLNGYAQSGDDAGLKALATKAAPKVQAHLSKAEALQTKLASAGGGSTAGR